MLKHYLPLAIVPVGLILWGLFGGTQLAGNSFRGLVNYCTPYTEKSPPGQAGDPLSERVVLIVADGMRDDVSRTLPNLNALRARGADRTAIAGIPSLSIPGYTVIGTGAWVEQHGQTTNFETCDEPRDGMSVTKLCAAKMESIFAAAQRAGLSTALAGSPSWEALFPQQFDRTFVQGGPPDAHHAMDAVRAQNDAIEAAAVKMLRDNPAHLTLVYFSQPDDAWHGYGVHSPEGTAAAQDVDARVGRLLAAMDLTRTTLLFTSDHGHVDRGGHGGAEPEARTAPLIAAGKGIEPGQYAAAVQADIAPTLAVLLGTAIPADNQGTPLFEMLAIPAESQAVRTVDWAQQIALRYDALARVIGVGVPVHRRLEEAKAWLSMGSPEAARLAAQSDVETTRAVVLAFREGRLLQERLQRTPALFVMLLPLAIYAWFMRRMRWEFQRPFIGAVLYFVIYYALFYGRGLSFSLSMLNEESQITAWFAERTLDAIMALAASSIAVGILSRDEFRIWTTLNSFNMCFLVAAALWAQIAGFYWLWDFTWAWYLPDMAQGFKFYLDTLQSGAFMVVVRGIPVPVILLLPLIALGAQWAAERVVPMRPSDMPGAARG